MLSSASVYESGLLYPSWLVITTLEAKLDQMKGTTMKALLLLGSLAAFGAMAGCSTMKNDKSADQPTDLNKKKNDSADDANHKNGDANADTNTKKDDPNAPLASGTPTPGASGPSVPQTYYPLERNYQWTYQVSNAPGSSCGSGEIVTQVRDTFTEDGVEKYHVDPICNYYGPGSQIMWKDGQDILTYIATSPVTRIFSGPPTINRTWSVNSALDATWEDAGTVTVQAGEFTNCWKAVNSRWGGWATYCWGVGPVKGGGDGGFSYELKSYNFPAL